MKPFKLTSWIGVSHGLSANSWSACYKAEGLMILVRHIVMAVGTLLYFSAQAESFTFKDWAWNTERTDFYFAATMNDAGHLLGQYCYFKSGSCFYFTGIGINCEIGNEYPALLNSDTGAAQISLVCSYKYQNQHVLAISPFDAIDRLIRSATRMGIAIALQNDQFKVSRFSLAGSTYTIDRMRAAAEAKMQRAPRNTGKPPAEERF
jgi:hypothetical protein